MTDTNIEDVSDESVARAMLLFAKAALRAGVDKRQAVEMLSAFVPAARRESVAVELLNLQADELQAETTYLITGDAVVTFPASRLGRFASASTDIIQIAAATAYGTFIEDEDAATSFRTGRIALVYTDDFLHVVVPTDDHATKTTNKSEEG